MIKVSSEVHPTAIQAIEELQTLVQRPVVQHFPNGAPLVGQVAQGSHVTANVGGTLYSYHNIGGKLYKVALTAA